MEVKTLQGGSGRTWQADTPQVIRIWKAPADAGPVKYVTVTEKGELVRAFKTLAEIREYHKHSIDCGAAVLKRELHNVYTPHSRKGGA